MVRNRMWALHLCFLGSGAVGLAYEVVWARALSLTFGHTVYALTTVLAAFMGGLALGSAWLGRLADRSRNPIRLYALLEIGIGLSCLAVPLLLRGGREIYLSLYESLGDSVPAKVLIQAALAGAVLIVPATLMGGTLPALVRGLTVGEESAARRTGVLYGWNTCGAALGAFAAGYWLIPAVGLTRLNYLGAGTNLALGAVAWLLAGVVSQSDRSADRRVPEGGTNGGGARRVLVVGFALSGAAAMLYQIVWVRALVLVIGSSTYALSAIVVTFLAGLAIGSWLFRWLPQEKPEIFGVLQLGIGVSAFLLVPLFGTLPSLFLALFGEQGGPGESMRLIQFLIVSLVTLPPTVLMGMTLPCLVSCVRGDRRALGRTVGNLYAWNTTGAIAGSLLTGFLLIPWLGAQRTLALGVATNLTVGAFVLGFNGSPRRRAVAVGILALALVPLAIPAWSQRIMLSGVYVYAREILAGENGGVSRFLEEKIERVLFFEEGLSSTVGVVEYRDGMRGLILNGKVDASTGPDMETQVNLALVPMLLHPEPKRIAVVGLGAGVTAGYVTLFAEPEAIDVIELEPAVIRALGWFAPQNEEPLGDPRVRVHTEDARAFLQGTGGSYDVITSETSNPWISGVASVFTLEHFQTLRRKLAPGGICCQWLQAYNMSPEDVRMVVRTFQKAFPNATLWAAGPVDLLLIGRGDGAARVTGEGIRGRVAKQRRLVDAFQRTAEAPVEGLVGNFLLDEDALRAFAGDGPLHTDDRPLLEFSAPLSLYANRSPDIEREILRLKRASHPEFLETDELAGREGQVRVGEHLLARRRAERALWHFRQNPSLAPLLAHGGGTESPLTAGGRAFAEGFDGPPALSLRPWIGGARPDGTDWRQMSLWEAAEANFTRVSGAEPGAGRGGSAGLALRGAVGLKTTAYFLSLPVELGASYRLEVWVRSESDVDVEAGVGLLELSAPTEEGAQPDAAFLERHRVRSRDLLRLRGSHDWQAHSVTFETSPETRSAHVLFYREGLRGDGPVVFDNIRVSRIR